ncbi:aspartyl-phosphate phosphatase Spo0E family protein [Tepidibacillus fermentans]|uniref:Spo0E like sporulation regulatory protein n=1 Tax=Tepidibacillus fermentans TaxID=1281767 RepID=A0A4R3KHZ4_9BACI|nr:aspartyl-phosphate phosphatase Spo0E family protein [Tepidibacillus fermentans]TCS83123.1 Spo0E like sporulation regulatory protein [Tepidibacillus fermentans]
MKRDLIKEFEEVRKEMEEKGKVLGFQHPLVLELSHRLDRIHNELLKKEKDKKNFRKNPRLYTIFESKMAYDTRISMA